MLKKYKKNIPNILTITRIIFTPLIIIFGLTNNLILSTIFIVLASITDYFDGVLARKWNVTSSFGERLDQIADKIFVISILIVLLTKYKLFITIFILELLIALINSYFYFKHIYGESLYIGKVKTVFIDITMILWFISNFIIIDKLLLIVSYLTIFFQIICIISYIIYYLDKQSK